jgi:SHS2 domain-containing protein
MNPPPYEEIEHTADWAIQVHGETLNELFENAANGMFSLLDPLPISIEAKNTRLELSAIDLETLLVCWLEELLYILETEHKGADSFKIEIEDTALKATFRSMPVQSQKKDIKAVTYNELEITQDDEGFHTTIVFDV